MAIKRVMSFPSDKFWKIFPETEGMSIDETLEFLKDGQETTESQTALYNKAIKNLQKANHRKDAINLGLFIMLISALFSLVAVTI